MKVEYNDVMSVLALFDTGDIPYIKSPNYLRFTERKSTGNVDSKEDKVKVKQKKIGDKNDGNR